MEKLKNALIILCLILTAHLAGTIAARYEEKLKPYDEAVKKTLLKYNFDKIPYDTIGPYGFWLEVISENLLEQKIRSKNG